MTKNIMRILTLVLCLAIITTCFVGCSDNHEDLINNPGTTTGEESETTGPADNSNNSETDAQSFTFLKLPAEGKEMEAYRAEVNRRLLEMNKDDNADFVTEDEEKFLEIEGYNVPGRGMRADMYNKTFGEFSTYYFPIVYQGEDTIQIWCMTDYGELRMEAVTGELYNGHTFDYAGNANYTTTGEEEIVRGAQDLAVVYDKDSGNVSFWSLGEKMSEHTVPEDSVYAGFSYWEGYIFRSGTDVYAVRDYGIYSNHESGVCVIAHNVKLVIDANYDMGSDDWAQPLFLMTDGSVKGYCSWMGDDAASADDESFLYDIRYEGGYHKE